LTSKSAEVTIITYRGVEQSGSSLGS
jgi:hypothetical protein